MLVSPLTFFEIPKPAAPAPTAICVGDYWVAQVIPWGEARVKVTRVEPSAVFVVTADLRDAGTRLVLDPEKLSERLVG